MGRRAQLPRVLPADDLGHAFREGGVACCLCGAETPDLHRTCADVRAEVAAWNERAFRENVAIGRIGDWKRHRKSSPKADGGPWGEGSRDWGRGAP